jgi:hypothetical protein
MSSCAFAANGAFQCTAASSSPATPLPPHAAPSGTRHPPHQRHAGGRSDASGDREVVAAARRGGGSGARCGRIHRQGGSNHTDGSNPTTKARLVPSAQPQVEGFLGAAGSGATVTVRATLRGEAVQEYAGKASPYTVSRSKSICGLKKAWGTMHLDAACPPPGPLAWTRHSAKRATLSDGRPNGFVCRGQLQAGRGAMLLGYGSSSPGGDDGCLVTHNGSTRELTDFEYLSADAALA